MANAWGGAIAGVVIGLGVGVQIGRYIAKKNLEALYDERLEDELENTRKYYAAREKRDEFSSPQRARETLAKTEYENVRAPYTNEAPYKITEDQFMLNENDYDQYAMTYYTGDKVLADQADEVVEDIEDFVGARNLNALDGDDAPGTLYIRNERRLCECEIVRSDNKYSVEVLGLEENAD